MKKIFVIGALLMVMLVPAFAQGRRMSPEDQGRFNSYYQRWQQYRQSNDRDQIQSMEQRMQELMGRYGIPSDVPYERIANGGNYGYGEREGDRDRDRNQYQDADRDHDRDRDRDHDRDHDRNRDRDQWRHRLSTVDQGRFNSYYTRWRDYQRDNNRGQIESMEKRMRGLMSRYKIPQDVEFDDVATVRR